MKKVFVGRKCWWVCSSVWWGSDDKDNKTYLSACAADPEAGFRLLIAFSHFVFIDGAVAAENLRSPRGEPGSTLLTNSSFCKWIKINEELKKQ